MMPESRDLRWARGFTLIELLVVVAIIALLISILLPSLSRARDQAKAVKCAANESGIGKAMHAYLAENRGVFPLAYCYPRTFDAGIEPDNQSLEREFGYLHWSWFLFSAGQVGQDAFTCPSFLNGGHPRTNPGTDASDWEEGQKDDFGITKAGAASAKVEDRQAKRMAYTTNAAVVPRNKLGNVVFDPDFGAIKRKNRFVNESVIKDSARTILATEFNRNWRLLAVGSDTTLVGKSHRPLNPFYNPSSGFNEYDLDPKLGLFRYWISESDKNYGLFPLNEIEEGGPQGDAASFSELNYVGRHHPGPQDRIGGAANFLFVDGHAERATVLSTLRDRKWGQGYYGINGKNMVSDWAWEKSP
jgi:prepilin-type N-terminal cleavage/methylation domain-containing protein/prepilin-type processing-associated H-X9-DG protein